jgi:hypothetical protein
MKNFTYTLSFLAAFMLLAATSYGQATWTDDFSTSHNYLSGDVTGTIWDRVIINDTIDGALAPKAAVYRLDTDTVPGTLTITSASSYWVDPPATAPSLQSNTRRYGFHCPGADR